MPLLPVFDDATSKDIWGHASPYLSTQSLLACSLVSKEWNKTFSPVLWAEPTKVLMKCEDPWKQLDAFMRTITKTRKETRHQVVSMDFRPLKDAGRALLPQPNLWTPCPRFGTGLWLICIIEVFPSIKFLQLDGLEHANLPAPKLMMRKVEEFPHNLLMRKSAVETPAINTSSVDNNVRGINAVDNNSQSNDAQDSSIRNNLRRHIINWNSPFFIDSSLPQHFAPLVVSAKDCQKFNIKTLRARNDHAILYLDISGTAMEKPLKSSFMRRGDFPNLRILKMRNLELTDAGMIAIQHVLQGRLFSLDVRNNKLTDACIPAFLHASMPNVPQENSPEDEEFFRTNFLAEPPEYVRDRNPDHDESTWDEWNGGNRPDDSDAVIEYVIRESKGWAGNIDNRHLGLDSDLTKKTGLTQLHVSGNRFTSDALANILATVNLMEVMDFGNPQPLANVSANLRYPNIKVIQHLISLNRDGVKVLYPRLCPRLRSLRVHHSLITFTPTLIPVGDFRMSEANLIALAEEHFAPPSMNQHPGIHTWQCPRLHTLILVDVPQRSILLVCQKLRLFLQELAEQEYKISQAKAFKSKNRRGPEVLTGLRVLRLEFATSRVESEQRGRQAVTSASGDPDADTFVAESSKDFSFFADDERDEDGKDSEDGDDGELRDRHTVTAASGRSVTNEQSPTKSTPQLVDVLGMLKQIRDDGKAKLAKEAERLGVPTWEVPPGPPHWHWSGRLEIVREQS